MEHLHLFMNMTPICFYSKCRGLKWHFLSILWARKAVSIPGGIQKPCSCGSWGRDLVVDLAALGSWLDSDLRGLFQPEWFCISVISAGWSSRRKQITCCLFLFLCRENPPPICFLIWKPRFYSESLCSLGDLQRVILFLPLSASVFCKA